MAHVLSEIWLCLLIAFLLGALLAWLLGRRGAAVAGPGPDLSAFVRRSELPAAPDLSGFVRRAELPAAPDLSAYAKRSELPPPPDLSAYAKRSELPDVTGLLRRADLPAALDLTAFVHRSELPATLSSPPAAPAPERVDLSGLARTSVLEAALGERDRAIAELRRVLEAQSAARAAEVAQLEAHLAEHLAAAAAPPPVAAAAAPLAAGPPAAAPARARRTRGRRRPDDLELIHGVGPVLERRLNRLGITRFIQIARWTDRTIDRIEQKLDSVPDRIRREGWVKDAARLHAEKYGRRRGR